MGDEYREFAPFQPDAVADRFDALPGILGRLGAPSRDAGGLPVSGSQGPARPAGPGGSAS